MRGNLSDAKTSEKTMRIPEDDDHRHEEEEEEAVMSGATRVRCVAFRVISPIFTLKRT